jgi:ABC-type bacteriocin/lantibiotic exporter with double-glycine peptidase domain
VAIAQTLTLIPIALLVRQAFDESIPTGDAGEVTLIGLASLALYLVSAALGLWARAISLRATKQSVTELRSDLLTKLYALPRSWFDHRDAAKVHGTIVQDSERIDQMTHALVAQLLPTAVVALGLTGAMLVLNPLLFGLLALVAPLLLLCSAIVGRAVRRRTHVWREQFEAFDSQTMFALRSITLTKAHGADAGEVAARRRQIEELGRRGYEMSWMQSAYSLVNGTIMAIGAVIVLIVGGRAVANGSMSLGDLISFFSLLALLRGQTPTLLIAIPSVISGMESLRRVEEVLAAGDEEPYRGRRDLRFGGHLALEGVEFSYDGPPVLRDVSLRLDPGERLVLIGPNGAGKSTLVSLVLGLYRPQRGRLTADGIPYDEIDMRSLRASIGVVMQDPIVFSGTIRENIGFGTPGLDDAALRVAADLATASDFIGRLPDGLDTQVGDEGVLLSGGQRQRLAIARALARRPSLLILDEPTTYLDARSAAGLIENLGRLDPAPAVLLVTHDPLIATHGDRSVELRDGRLTQPVPA